MISVAIVSDAVARLVAIQESIEYGDSSTAHAIAHDLELELAGAIARAADERVSPADFNYIPDIDAV